MTPGLPSLPPCLPPCLLAFRPCLLACRPCLLAFRPFLDPLPVWDVWVVLIAPLCIGIAVVWKSIKCRSMADVPREAATLLAWVIGGFAAAAAVLIAVVKALTP